MWQGDLKVDVKSFDLPIGVGARVDQPVPSTQYTYFEEPLYNFSHAATLRSAHSIHNIAERRCEEQEGVNCDAGAPVSKSPKPIRRSLRSTAACSDQTKYGTYKIRQNMVHIKNRAIDLHTHIP